jgi:oligoendopeptidase F
MKKRLVLLLSLLLALSVLLQGCLMPFPSDRFDYLTEETTEPTKPTDRGEPAEADSYLPYDEFPRPEEAELEPVAFEDMEYTRPDAAALCKALGELEKLVKNDGSFDEVGAAFEAAYSDYSLFNTMDSLSYIRHTIDLNDEYYETENNWCEEQSPLIEQALEKCYIAMGQSDLRDRLEEEYFTEDFFDFYDENQIYSNDRVVKLMQKDNDLQAQYMALQSDQTIEWNGEEVLYEDIIGDESLDYDSYLTAYQLYYNKYNPQVGEIFAEMIRTRNEIAKELGYDTFADFAYSYYYDRDYTPEEAEDYLSDIAAELAPMYFYAVYGAQSTTPCSTDEVLDLFEKTVYRFGGEFATSYEFMQAYDLMDITDSSSKMPGSYVTYLSSYQMPFLYVSPTGKLDDLLTCCHEFGHFVDGFVNCNGTSSIDCNEIFSQGLEFLSLSRAELDDDEREALTISKVADSLLTFVSQAAYAEFELRAYALPDDQLNTEGLNALFLECMEEFGQSYTGMEDIIAPGWIDIQHFLIAPYYVISYCVSNDAALQIFQLEEENGTGLETYRALMSTSSGNTILALLEENGMESPFEPGRVEELADFFEDYLS